MKISERKGDFTPCPEYSGVAVCVDVTPPETKQTKFGPADQFRVVFEIPEKKEDGERFCVWSRPFTPSLNEKAAFRKFLRQWLGRQLTAEELVEFDTESLIGKNANIIVGHESGDAGEVYANIEACLPWKGDTFAACGKFTRKKDRQKSGGENGGEYKRAAQPDAAVNEKADAAAKVDETQAGSNWQQVKVHVGKHKGVEIADLDQDAITNLHDKWLPIHQKNAKPTADDKRLALAVVKAMEVVRGLAPVTGDLQPEEEAF
jgi:hypothetical protein